MKKSNLYILGGAGYIGSVVCEYMYRKYKNKFRLIIIDSKIYKFQKYHFKKAKFINVEISKISNFIEPQKDDIVIILSGLVGDPIAKKYQKISSIINFHNTKKVINFFYNKVNRILFISTCSNYGIKKNNSINETAALKPISLYAKDKVKIEKFILKKRNRTSTSLCVFRFATAFGFSRRMRFDLTVNDFCYQMLKSKSLEIYDANTWRPYCHVLDFARAIEKFIFARKNLISQQVYNIGSNNHNYRKIDIYNAIKKVVKKNKFKTVFASTSKDRRNYIVNFNKVKNKLKFKPKFNLIFGIKEIIRNIKKNNYNKKDLGNYSIKKKFLSSLKNKN